MIEALRLLPDWHITIYKSKTTSAYSRFNLPMRNLEFSKKKSLILAALSGMDINISEKFYQEDVLISPSHSAYLLHTFKPFIYTLHDLQERHLPQNFTFIERWWMSFILSVLSKRASGLICEI